MTKTLSLVELRKMTPGDIRKEITEQRDRVAKLRLTVKSGKEKGSHLLRRERRMLARMLTILGALQTEPSSRTIRAPKR